MQKYEVKKTVRFELEAKLNTQKPIIWDNKNYEKNLKIFIEIYKNSLEILQKILFKDNKLNKYIKIKFSFLKTYCKYEFYKFDITGLKSKSNNKIYLSNNKLLFLFNLLKEKINNNLDIIESLEESTNLPEEDKNRKSEINFYFSKLIIRDNFEFIKQLSKNLSSEKPYFAKQIDEINKKFELIKNSNLIENLSLTLKSTWTFWVEILRASLNFYTVNKKTKDYDDKIKNKKYEFNKLIWDFKDKKNKDIFDNNIVSTTWFNDFLQEFDDSYFGEIKDYNWINKKEKKYKYLSIKDAYELMKQYKAEQKQAFIQFLAK